MFTNRYLGQIDPVEKIAKRLKERKLIPPVNSCHCHCNGCMRFFSSTSSPKPPAKGLATKHKNKEFATNLTF